MISYDEFVKAFNTELVGDRLLGEVDGKRCVVAEVADGRFELTEEGRELARSLEVETPVEVPVEAPRKRGRPAAE